MARENAQPVPVLSSADRREALLDGQRRVLERIATGAPLADVLYTLVTLIEEQGQGLRCGVLLADAAQTRLRIVAAPHIPEDYRLGMEPWLRIAPDTGACGTAAYLREPVYTRDVAADPRWSACREIALRNGLRAIWSTPILSDDNRVLGTFAMYYDEPRLPDDDHVQLIEVAVQMARIAIEAKADDDLVRAIFDNAPRAMVITDMEGNIERVNQALALRLGYATGDLRGKPVAEITGDHDHAALVTELLASDGEAWRRRHYRRRDGRMLWARERSSLRRDPTGRPRYVATCLEALHEEADDPLARLSRRECEVLKLVVAGRTSKAIAARLRVAPASVDTYRSRIMFKLGIGDLPGLVRFAIRHGIVTL